MRRFRLAMIGVGLSVPFLLVSIPSTATAAAYNCSSWRTGDQAGGQALCTSLPSYNYVRVVVSCAAGNGYTWTASGPWVRNRETSRVWCSSDPDAAKALSTRYQTM